LIKRVLGPAVHEELLLDLKDSIYSLIVDESTDITLEKQLCVMVRYYSSTSQKITTTFLGLLSLESGTADGIFQAIKNFLQLKNISISRCFGLATDGCSAMCGKNNSVITKFREVCPNIVHIKCICHSIQLCSSYALKVMPRNVEFMVAETYNWFCHSTARQQKYKALYTCMNVGEDPLKILKLSDTRWLSIAPCVKRVLDQFDELKLHFQLAKDEERNYTAELLYNMYTAVENKLYLVFLQPILQELNRVNKLFELDRASPVKLLSELMTLYRCILNRIMRPTTFSTWASTLQYNIDDQSNHLPLAAVNFGIQFQIILAESNIGHTNPKLSEDIKIRCRNYLMELLKEMRQRLPTNVERLESLSDLSPSLVLGKQKSHLATLSFLPLFHGNIGNLEQQWNRLSLFSWSNTEDTDVEHFWVEVANHTDASGEHDFHDLGNFALSLLALPFSNASVERTFSQMNLIKSKLRNKMQQSLLENLLHIRAYMARNNICCNNFQPTTSMMSRFTSDMYENNATENFPENLDF
jgi:Domain of unknown function (DUF4371)/hAT family C-terminal dimerisation region